MSGNTQKDQFELNFNLYNVNHDLSPCSCPGPSPNLNYETIMKELSYCENKIGSLVTEDIPLGMELLKLQQYFNDLIGVVAAKMDEKSDAMDNNQELNEDIRETLWAKRKKNHQQPKTNIILNEVDQTRVIPCVSGLKDIIGMYEIKKELKIMFLLPERQPQLFQNRHRCNSFLLFGPPGTGKTKLINAIAAEIDAVFHSISASDLLCQYVGLTEKKIKTLFQYLKETPNTTVLFIDEIDAFCKKRDSNEQDYNRRIKTEFQCQMNNIAEYENVFLIAATNCPWDIDSAILRRFQRRIYIPLPTPEERMELFQYLVPDTQIQLEQFSELVHKTEGYSGSDLENVVQHALNYPLIELEDTAVWKITSDGYFTPQLIDDNNFSMIRCSKLMDLPCNSVLSRKSNFADFLKAIDRVTPTVSLDDVAKYLSFRNKK